MKSKQLKELAERLQYLNEWRRGAESEMPPTKQITQDIDEAIKVIRKYNDKNR